MLKLEVKIFLVVGILSVLIDFSVYQVCLYTGLLNIDTSKGIGFLLGAIFSYVANRNWTFQYTLNSLLVKWRFILLYLITLGLNVVVNSLVLKINVDNYFTNYIAFILATGLSAISNFFGMKFFVFKK
jgi:putative flippase GtrA